jgi:hypothetical protein
MPKNPTITLFQISYCFGTLNFPVAEGRNIPGEQKTHENGSTHAPKRLLENLINAPGQAMSANSWFLNTCRAAAK